MRIIKGILIWIACFLFVSSCYGQENGYIRKEIERYRICDDSMLSKQELELLRKDAPDNQCFWYYDHPSLDKTGKPNYLFLVYWAEPTIYEVYKLGGEPKLLCKEQLNYCQFISFEDLNGDKIDEMILADCGATGRGEMDSIFKWTGSRMESISDTMGGNIGVDFFDLDGDGVKEIIKSQDIHDEEDYYKIKNIEWQIYKWEGNKGYVLWKTMEKNPIAGK